VIYVAQTFSNGWDSNLYRSLLYASNPVSSHSVDVVILVTNSTASATKVQCTSHVGRRVVMDGPTGSAMLVTDGLMPADGPTGGSRMGRRAVMDGPTGPMLGLGPMQGSDGWSNAGHRWSNAGFGFHPRFGWSDVGHRWADGWSNPLARGQVLLLPGVTMWPSCNRDCSHLRAYSLSVALGTD
jgi:hypothetical protein